MGYPLLEPVSKKRSSACIACYNSSHLHSAVGWLLARFFGCQLGACWEYSISSVP